MRTVLKLLIGDYKEVESSGCSVTATAVPKGPSLEAVRLTTVAPPFSLVAHLHCTTQEQATAIAAKLTDMYAAKKTTSGLLMVMETKRVLTTFESRETNVDIVLQLGNQEEMTAMFGIVESMLPELFQQHSKVTVSFTTVKSLAQSSATDLQFLYSLFEGSKVEVVLELWNNLFRYIRDQTKEVMLPPELQKLLTIASIYSRGSLELKLRGAHAIPAEIREKVIAYSNVLDVLRGSIANNEDPALSDFVRTVAASCLPTAELTLSTSLFQVSIQANVPGLSNLFLKTDN